MGVCDLGGPLSFQECSSKVSLLENGGTIAVQEMTNCQWFQIMWHERIFLTTCCIIIVIWLQSRRRQSLSVHGDLGPLGVRKNQFYDDLKMFIIIGHATCVQQYLGSGYQYPGFPRHVWIVRSCSDRWHVFAGSSFSSTILKRTVILACVRGVVKMWEIVAWWTWVIIVASFINVYIITAEDSGKLWLWF